jgi:hypothetical protein
MLMIDRVRCYGNPKLHTTMTNLTLAKYTQTYIQKGESDGDGERES